MSSATQIPSSGPSPVSYFQTYSFPIPPTSPTPSNNPPLPLAAIVGIVVGGLIIGILAAIALGCLIWRFRARPVNYVARPGCIIEVKEKAPDGHRYSASDVD